jgi:hypothetical protein
MRHIIFPASLVPWPAIAANSFSPCDLHQRIKESAGILFAICGQMGKRLSHVANFGCLASRLRRMPVCLSSLSQFARSAMARWPSAFHNLLKIKVSPDLQRMARMQLIISVEGKRTEPEVTGIERGGNIEANGTFWAALPSNFQTIGVFMARFDFSNNDYEWGFSFQMGGHSLFFESTILHESSERVESAPLTGAKPVQKKVTRKIRRPSYAPMVYETLELPR